ncbi:alpha/beta hydrolase [Pseudotamlana carrageenivorans]|uniref:Alpha/beta hydrolase n=1 Tax=Pseudotamlana carrageenivorans TaxID=2069432 RepID=A0A2I7SJF6_9FLAO|nr:alpha/beta hydrolase [Tamlana carrageenivorans]AUS06039.1 alpha/beta hydrolase [Tamlana carrageenivorans]
MITKSIPLKVFFIGLIFGYSIISTGQEHDIELWTTPPNAIENKDYQAEFRLNNKGVATGIRKVTQPSLKVFLAKNDNTKTTPAVIICPGGGYQHLSHIKEGEKVAEWLNSIGISAFVLKYRLPSDKIMINKTIGSLQDAQEAMRTVRRQSKAWHINPNKIGVMGFSAGGHLAATLSTHYKDSIYSHDNTSARPDFSILIYPVISMKDDITHQGSRTNLLGENPSPKLINQYSNEDQVTPNTPPTFLIHATNDQSVPVENSINYYLALKENNVHVEMHIYANGGHGFGLGTTGTNVNWPKACEAWLKAQMRNSQP